MKDLRKKRLIVAIEDFSNSCLPTFPSTGSVSKCGMDITEALERIYNEEIWILLLSVPKSYRSL